MFEFLKGKKTFIVSAVGVALAVAEYFGVHIPQPAYIILGALGFTTTRLAIKDAVG